MCKHAHISHFIMGSMLSCYHGERTPDVPLLLERSRPGLAAAWVQRYVTKCQHVLYTCVGIMVVGCFILIESISFVKDLYSPLCT